MDLNQNMDKNQKLNKNSKKVRNTKLDHNLEIDHNPKLDLNVENGSKSKKGRFWHFNELWSTQNVNIARFTRNVKCDFLGDFQTL